MPTALSPSDTLHVFFMAKQIATAIVAAPEDLVPYRVKRYNYSEIFKKYPDVNAVIHSHAESVIPYGISGTSTPVYEISALYTAEDKKDMLVRDIRLGKGLAECFGKPNSDALSPGTEHAVMMMRSHGMTVVAPNIEECVLRAIYTQQNASILTTVLTTRAAYNGPAILPEACFLNDTEAADSALMTHWSSGRPWKLWVKEVEQAGLYVNEASETYRK